MTHLPDANGQIISLNHLFSTPRRGSLTTLLLVAACASATVLGTAQASPSGSIHVRTVAKVMTNAGVDLRFSVRGATGRAVIELRFGRAGTRGMRTQRHVIHQIGARRTVTFHLHALTGGARYGYAARVLSGTRRATVYGFFTVGTAPGTKTTPPLTTIAPPTTTAPVIKLVPPPTAVPPPTTTPPPAFTRPPTTTPPPVSTTPPLPAPLPAPTGPVYYVSSSGSDTADGSSGRPWKTLAKAAASTPAGATALVAAGTYAGFTMTRSGTSGAPIVIQAASAGAVKIDPPSGGSTITIAGVHDVTLAGLVIQGALGSQNAGVDVLDGSARITVSGGTIANNRSYGVDVNGSTYVTIRGNTITGNDTGIRINRAGAGVLIENNDVVNNAGMIVNDAAPGTDWGAVGISFLHTVGPVIARGNTIHGNRAPSMDYGYDGSGFEIYGASGLTMTANRIWDNQNVIETGTDGAACSGNTFARNTAWGGNVKSAVSPRGPQVNGIFLRCGQGMLIANNVFSDLDYFVYDISASRGVAANLAGFRIQNNVSYQAGHKIYALGSAVPADGIIDYNVSMTSPGAAFASVSGKGNVATIESFRSLTGKEAHGRFANPLFMNRAAADFRLGAGSPAIDAGTQIPGVTDGFAGSAPDAGAYESGS